MGTRTSSHERVKTGRLNGKRGIVYCSCGRRFISSLSVSASQKFEKHQQKERAQ